jgi:CrcB protein
MRLAVAVGFLGSYTTFSTLMHDSNRMIGDGAGIGGMANLVLSFVLGLAAVKWGVYWAGR